MLGCEGTERGEKRTVSVRLRPDRKTVSEKKKVLTSGECCTSSSACSALFSKEDEKEAE